MEGKGNTEKSNNTDNAGTFRFNLNLVIKYKYILNAY